METADGVDAETSRKRMLVSLFLLALLALVGPDFHRVNFNRLLGLEDKSPSGVQICKNTIFSSLGCRRILTARLPRYN